MKINFHEVTDRTDDVPYRAFSQGDARTWRVDADRAAARQRALEAQRYHDEFHDGRREPDRSFADWLSTWLIAALPRG